MSSGGSDERLVLGLRVVLVVAVVSGTGMVLGDFLSGAGAARELSGRDSTAVEMIEVSDSSYQPEELTVISSVKVDLSSASEKGALLAVTPSGKVVYEDRSYNIYDDVDPSPSGRYTVSYLSAVVLQGAECQEFESDRCTLNFIEQVNITTGEKTRLYSAKTPRVQHTRWHDADRIDAHRFILADLAEERVAIVNTTSDTVEWSWYMESRFNRSTSGWDNENDWAHINDVERLDDGRIMFSPRNHDQILFLSPDGRLLENWTLGADNQHEILYEQHNPDYLTNGPRDSVLIADSQNNRIVEYARTDDGGWERTWAWQDDELQWPRDADRLPNGHTLISDTSGKRVFEIDRDGEIVWGVRVDGNYEAERLGTGDESLGGPTAVQAGLSGTNSTESSRLLPPQLRNGALYVLPGWGSMQTVIGIVLAVVGCLGLTGLELWVRADVRRLL